MELDFWIILSIGLGVFSLLFTSAMVFLLAKIKCSQDTLSLAILIIFVTCYFMKTLISLLLDFLLHEDYLQYDQEGQLYLSIVVSNIFFLITAIYTFKMKGVFYHITCDEFSLYQRKIKQLFYLKIFFYISYISLCLGTLVCKIQIDVYGSFNEHEISSIFYIFFTCAQFLPESYIIYQMVILFLFFKDLKVASMKSKKQEWTLFHSFIFFCILFIVSIQLTRIIYDDLVLPLFIERPYADDVAKITVGRKIQIIIGDFSDTLTGIGYLYLFYHNAKLSLDNKKKRNKRKHQQKLDTNGNEIILPSSNPQSALSRPNYGTQSINSILMNSQSPLSTEKKAGVQIGDIKFHEMPVRDNSIFNKQHSDNVKANPYQGFTNGFQQSNHNSEGFEFNKSENYESGSLDDSLYVDENSEFDSDELAGSNKGEQFESFLRSLKSSLVNRQTTKSKGAHKSSGTWESSIN